MQYINSNRPNWFGHADSPALGQILDQFIEIASGAPPKQATAADKALATALSSLETSKEKLEQLRLQNFNTQLKAFKAEVAKVASNKKQTLEQAAVELKAQAQGMLQTAAQAPDAWQLCVTRLEVSTYAEVKFWCLQTLHAVVSAPGYPSLPPAARDQIKRSLVAAGTGSAAMPLPGFLRNKIAQALVAIAAREYPDRWPTFFQDLLGTLGQGREAVDLFCRILVAVDDDIISLEVPRSAEEAKQGSRFKDAMRERSLPDVALAWSQLVAAYKDTAPDTAASVLDAVQRYVHWIDIALVANDSFVPLLFSVLNSAHEAPRAAAAAVLTEIVSKRMEAGPKLTLIQSLGVVPVCAQWATTGRWRRRCWSLGRK